MVLILKLVLVQIAFAGAAFQVVPTIPTKQKPLMIYFGGYRASSSDMQTWEKGCREEYGAQYDFEGNPYGGKSSDEKSALAGAGARIEHYIKLIQANPEREFVIVGHSSGASIPAAIAAKLPASARVKIVVLDGFNSGARFQDKFPTVCYSAMHDLNCKNNTKFQSPSCTSKMCGHFRVLNKSAPANASIATGYANFSCNLDWMKRFPSPAHGSPPVVRPGETLQ